MANFQFPDPTVNGYWSDYSRLLTSFELNPNESDIARKQGLDAEEPGKVGGRVNALYDDSTTITDEQKRKRKLITVIALAAIAAVACVIVGVQCAVLAPLLFIAVPLIVVIIAGVRNLSMLKPDFDSPAIREKHRAKIARMPFEKIVSQYEIGDIIDYALLDKIKPLGRLGDVSLECATFYTRFHLLANAYRKTRELYNGHRRSIHTQYHNATAVERARREGVERSARHWAVGGHGIAEVAHLRDDLVGLSRSGNILDAGAGINNLIQTGRMLKAHYDYHHATAPERTDRNMRLSLVERAYKAAEHQLERFYSNIKDSAPAKIVFKASEAPNHSPSLKPSDSSCSPYKPAYALA